MQGKLSTPRKLWNPLLKWGWSVQSVSSANFFLECKILVWEVNEAPFVMIWWQMMPLTIRERVTGRWGGGGGMTNADAVSPDCNFPHRQCLRDLSLAGVYLKATLNPPQYHITVIFGKVSEGPWIRVTWHRQPVVFRMIV